MMAFFINFPEKSALLSQNKPVETFIKTFNSNLPNLIPQLAQIKTFIAK